MNERMNVKVWKWFRMKELINNWTTEMINECNNENINESWLMVVFGVLTYRTRYKQKKLNEWKDKWNVLMNCNGWRNKCWVLNYDFITELLICV